MNSDRITGLTIWARAGCANSIVILECLAEIKRLQGTAPQNVKAILREWLELHGYDGLQSDDGVCGCQLDSLFWCDGPCDSCQPGYRGPDPTGECESLIYATREDAAQAELQAEHEANKAAVARSGDVTGEYDA